MEKDKGNNLVWYGIVFAVILCLGILTYVYSGTYDQDCLNGYALTYCQKNNMTWAEKNYDFLVVERGFTCTKLNPNYNARMNYQLENLYYDYNYLEEEMDSCYKPFMNRDK